MSLADRLLESFPTATKWRHPDGITIPHEDGFITANASDDGAGSFLLTVCGTSDQGEVVTLDRATEESLIEVVEYLTTIQPEGTDWLAWAEQWLLDQYDAELVAQ